MLLAALFLIPTLLHPAEPTMPFYAVMKREAKEDNRPWQKATANLRTIEEVNNYWNHSVKFADDIDTWHVPDYWTTPAELYGIKKGDCEDYAIAKYYTLRSLGFSADRLRLTAVILNGQIHVVLIVDKTKVLDCITDTIRNVEDIPTNKSSEDGMFALYSINEESFWMTW